MAIRDGGSLSYLLDEYAPSADELAEDHAMDISSAIYLRMRELGLTQSELASRLGMDEGQVSRIIRGKQNITIKTLARIEVALDFRLDSGFDYTPAIRGEEAVYTIPGREYSADRESSMAEHKWGAFGNGKKGMARAASLIGGRNSRLKVAA